MAIDNPTQTASLSALSLQTDYPICIPGGRLSLSLSSPIADGSSSSAVHYLPYESSLVPLWDNEANCWVYGRIPEAGLTLNLGSENPRNIDIYAQLNRSVEHGFILVAQGWSSSTGRLQAIARKQGVWCVNFNDPNLPFRTLLGSARLTGTAGSATLSDTATARLLFNAYHRVKKRVFKVEAQGNWQYASSTIRRMNNSTANRIEVIDGFGTNVIQLTYNTRISAPSSNFGQIGFGVNTETSFTDGYNVIVGGMGHDAPARSSLDRSLGLGYHYIQAMEAASGGMNVTFYGAGYCGLSGVWEC